MTNAAFGIYFPKFVGTIYELLSAPVSAFEIVLGYVGAAASKSIVLGLIILATAGLFVPLRIAHPVLMMGFLVLTAVSFSLFGFIIGLWADGFEKLQVGSAPDHHAADVPGRQFLFDQRAAAGLADRHPVQSDRLSGQRLSLELLEVADVNVGISTRHDGAVPARLSCDRLVDVQNRLPDQAVVTSSAVMPAHVPASTHAWGQACAISAGECVLSATNSGAD